MTRDGRKLLYDLHSWAGFVVGIALLIVCLSGAIAVFSPEIDRWSNPVLRVAEGPVTVDPDTALARLIAAVPPDPGPVSLGLPGSSLPGLYGIIGPASASFAPRYLDAGSGELRPPRSNQVFFFLRHLHVRLLYNRLPVGIVGVAMLLSIATGILIHKHILRDMFRMRWRRTGNVRVTLADFHKVIGFWALLFHIAIASTGTWLALEGTLKPVIETVAGRAGKAPGPGGRPTPDTAAPPAARLAGMIAQSRTLIADFAPTHVTITPQGTVRVSGDVPGLVQQGASHVLFDGSTGQATNIVDIRAQGFWTQFRYALEPIHYGYYGGFWVKLLYLLVGLMPAALSITGAVLWFERQRGAGPARVRFMRAWNAALAGATAAVPVTLCGAAALSILAPQVEIGRNGLTPVFLSLWGVLALACGMAARPLAQWIAAAQVSAAGLFGLALVYLLAGGAPVPAAVAGIAGLALVWIRRVVLGNPVLPRTRV